MSKLEYEENGMEERGKNGDLHKVGTGTLTWHEMPIYYSQKAFIGFLVDFNNLPGRESFHCFVGIMGVGNDLFDISGGFALLIKGRRRADLAAIENNLLVVRCHGGRCACTPALWL